MEWLQQLLLSHQKISENFSEGYACSNKPELRMMVRYAMLTHWTQLLIFQRQGVNQKLPRRVKNPRITICS